MSKVPGPKDADDTGPSQSVFLNEWHIYRKMVENNYLHHREAYLALRRFILQERREPFSFFDIACGDASATARALDGTNVAAYYGIDISRAALELATKELQKLKCSVRLECCDYSDVLKTWAEPINIAWIGISLHHFLYDDKLSLMREITRFLAPDGALLIYEPTSPDGEARDGWISRFERQRKTWIEYTPEESEVMGAHIRGSDFPETHSQWQQLGYSAGFTVVRELFKAPTDLFRLYSFRKGVSSSALT